MAELSDFRLHPGDLAPPFELPGTDGRTYRLDDFRDARLFGMVFWCNHCPYVRAWEGRMIDLGRRYERRGVRFVLVNANDAHNYPEDGFDRMAEKARELHYPFPYLRDESQTVARAYGALVTPHPMLFGPDRRLLYQGRIDESHDHPEAVRDRSLEAALDSGLAGRPIERSELPVRGCSVKWRA
jgi:peroxiredoxin